jgi:hypothetical protein
VLRDRKINNIKIVSVQVFIGYQKYKNSRTMCCSQNPFIRNERATTEIRAVNYNGHLPRELATICSVAIGDVRVCIKHVDFLNKI